MATRETTGRWDRRELRDRSEPSISIDLVLDELEQSLALEAPEPAPLDSTEPEVRPQELEALRDLEVMVSNATSATRRAQLLEALAEGYDAIRRPDAAASAYQRLFAVDPTHDAAFARTEATLRDERAYGELVDAYLARVEVARGRERIDVIRRAATLLETELDDAEQALEAWVLAWGLDPTAKETTAELSRLAARTGAYDLLVEAADAELSRKPARLARVAILQAESEWYAALGRHDEARACLDAVLAEQPGDAEALEARARALEAAGEVDELVETLGLLARAQPTRREEADQYVAMGDLCRERLGRPEDAAAAYLAAVSTVPHHEIALSRLDSLYATELDPDEDGPDDIEPLSALVAHHGRNGDHRAAVALMARLARVLPAHLDRVDMRVRIARTVEAKLADADGALDRWEQVIELAPLHREANAAIRRILAERGDHRALARAIEAEAERSDEPAHRAELLTEAARIWEETLGDPARAQDAWARALESDPTQVDAALRLARGHAQRGRFERAYELLVPLKRQLHRQPVEVKREARRMLGEAAFAIGRDDEAIEALSAAADGDPSPRSLLALVIACFRARRFDDVVTWVKALVERADDALVLAKYAEVHHMLGVAQAERGDVGAAARAFRQALAHDAGHLPSLEDLVALEEKRERWEAAAELREQLARHAENRESRVRRLEELGDVCMQRLSQLPRAVQVYEEAISQQPDDHRVLHKLLDAYQKSGRWADALAVIARIQALEPRPEVRVRYAYTAGVILRDEIGDVDQALAWFHEALSIDPAFLKAFAAIDAMLTKARDWGRLERSYRKALKGVVGKGNPDLEFQLWHNLGLVYRDRLHDHPRAIDAFRMASRIQPDNREEHRILAELFSSVGRAPEETAADHQALLDEDPKRVGSYHALFELYARAGDHVRARAAAAALVFLGEADASEREYVAQVGTPVLSPQKVFGSEHWAALRHPDLTPELSVIYESLVEPLRALRRRSDADLGLDAADEVAPPGSTIRVASLFFGLARYLRLPGRPRLFVCRERRGGLVHAGDADPPASVCGATPLGGFTTQELEFIVAHHLADYEREMSIRTILRTPSELREALAAVTSPQPEGSAAARLAGAVDPRRMAHVRAAWARLSGRDIDRTVQRWCAAADITAARLGFLVCHDLAAAASILRDLPPPSSGLAVSYLLTDLARFSVSETYLSLVASLG